MREGSAWCTTACRGWGQSEGVSDIRAELGARKGQGGKRMVEGGEKEGVLGIFWPGAAFFAGGCVREMVGVCVGWTYVWSVLFSF